MIYLSSLIGKMRQQFRNITEFAHQMKSCDFQTVTLSILNNRLIFIYLFIYRFFFFFFTIIFMSYVYSTYV